MGHVPHVTAILTRAPHSSMHPQSLPMRSRRYWAILGNLPPRLPKSLADSLAHVASATKDAPNTLYCVHPHPCWTPYQERYAYVLSFHNPPHTLALRELSVNLRILNLRTNITDPLHTHGPTHPQISALEFRDCSDAYEPPPGIRPKIHNFYILRLKGQPPLRVNFQKNNTLVRCVH